MKIIDSFLFSEVFEKELLLIKFILEDPYVNEWILLENAYSFQGEYKGLHAKNLLDSDVRFAVYRDRITIIAKEMRPEVLNKSLVLDEKAFKVEFWQRNLAHDYFINNYSDNDWIIISDVDEALDFTDEIRCNELFERIENDTQGVLHVATRRYWFDFDNAYKIMYGIPMCTRKYLLENGKKLHDVRFEYHGDLKMQWKNIIGFEYSSCFDAGHIIRKLETGAHMGFSEINLKQALFCNHRVISEKRKRTLKPTNKFMLDTILLDESNSPKYVRDNLPTIKTNNIDPNYLENRLKAYPKLYSRFYELNEFVDKKKKNIKRKLSNLMRRLHLEKLMYE